MLRYTQIKLFEWGVIDKMGESAIEAAIERERIWIRTARVRYWPRLEKAEARRALEHLESLLGRVRAFARARGLQLQPAASDGKLSAAA
jgi:hypothetical protein